MSATSRAARLPRQRPVTSAEEQVGLNGAVAAALTRIVGSMPALYVVLVVFAGWMMLATWSGPLHRADPYPFPFLLFLDNVAQLVLCLVILVGQRVLGMAADRRAVQTYESAEAIFKQIADLQEHLDRHDRALSRGVSLLESSPHPWIQRHRVQPPPQALDHAVGVNGRIAAWLTQRLGSMWAFYVAALTQVVWITLPAVGVRFDPYPFAFMSFLSTLAQLIFMIVIMVGQGVLERAGDRRSEQTYLNAEAILHECGRMKARLTAQDRLIDTLSGYTTGEITERLARALHDLDRSAVGEAGQQATAGNDEAAGSSLSPPLWEELSAELKDQARAQARQLGEQLAAIGCLLVPAFDPALPSTFAFSDEEVHLLAHREHERQMAEQRAQGPAQESSPQDRTRPDLLPWEQLPEAARARKLHGAASIPGLLAGVGLQVVRDTRAHDGAGETDFTTQEWTILQQALMASGILVALAVGVVDSEEMFALIKMLRQASITHPMRLIRELTAASTFDTGLQPDTRYADYKTGALETIRSATAIVTERAPAELPGFRAFLTEIATVVANANEEGGFFGIGAHSRTPQEAAAIQAVRRATEPER